MTLQDSPLKWSIGTRHPRINRNTLAAFLRSRSRLVWHSKTNPMIRGNTYDVGRNAAKRNRKAFWDSIMVRLNK